MVVTPDIVTEEEFQTLVFLPRNGFKEYVTPEDVEVEDKVRKLEPVIDKYLTECVPVFSDFPSAEAMFHSRMNDRVLHGLSEKDYHAVFDQLRNKYRDAGWKVDYCLQVSKGVIESTHEIRDEYLLFTLR